MGKDTLINCWDDDIHIYAMFTKVKITADPAWAWRLWNGLQFAGNANPSWGPKAQIQGTSEPPADYKPEYVEHNGNKYMVSDSHAYKVNGDGSLCGITLVAKGPVKVTVKDEHYSGHMEWPLQHFNGIIKLPSVYDEKTCQSWMWWCTKPKVRQENEDKAPKPDPKPVPVMDSSVAGAAYTATLDVIDLMCKNLDIPYSDIGRVTLEWGPATPA
jgi:hypothetical protein